MKKSLLFLIGALCAMHVFAQTTFTVSPSGTNSGTSYTSIKGAMAKAVSGDVINVSAGTYTENAISWSLKSLTIKGAGMNQTIIDGGAANNIFVFDGAYTSADTITLQDMTIQNGKKSSYSGTAVRLKNTGTTTLPTFNLVNLKITNNIGGGGVYALGAILNVTGCYITGNTQTTDATSAGGGIWATGLAGFPVTVTIKNSTIANNSSIGNGGGISVTCAANGSSSVTNSLLIENSTIYNNSIVTTANRTGGGVQFRTCTTTGQATTPINNLTINYCTIANNTTPSGIGADGVSIDNSGAYATNLVMNNSMVMGNSGSTTNISQIGTSNSDPGTSGKIVVPTAITNSIFGIISGGTWATTATNNKLDAVIGDLAFDAGLSSDPVPVLKIGISSIAKDYVTSNNQLTSITTDELGTIRDAKPDAGAYENPMVSEVNMVNLNANVRLNGREINITGISGTVEIYNPVGESICTRRILGNGSILMNKSGVYIIKINTGNKFYFQKLLIK